ncbi:MAG: hypothetical protein C4574_04180 [Candidatus Latescibacterota bacterium]|nr:MAG: hypothetical protein C4574_04180 [Candidatus Latescibacterota bacterium]
MTSHNGVPVRPRRLLPAAIACLALLAAASCSRSGGGAGLKLPGDVYGFYLGETKEEVFARAAGHARIERAPDPPLGYRGELYNFSASLDGRGDVDYVRCAFFEGRLMEVIVYFRDAGLMNLELQKAKLESVYERTFAAEDPSREMAQKTLRFSIPGMSVTLRRITKKERIELYAQFLHEELHGRLLEKASKRGER